MKGDLKLVDCEDAGRRRDHGQCAAVGPLQADARRVRRRRQEFCNRRGMNYLLANNQACRSSQT